MTFSEIRLKMMPSLDIYSFGMVVLFLFAEKNWWDIPNRSSPNTTHSLRIKHRETQMNNMITELRGRDILQKIAQQLYMMLDRDPERRPSAKECVFELGTTYNCGVSV